MGIGATMHSWNGPLAAAAEGADAIPPPTRAAALMALVGIGLLGMLIVVVILLGGHWVRRQQVGRRGPVVPPDRAPLRREKGGEATGDE